MFGLIHILRKERPAPLKKFKTMLAAFFDAPGGPEKLYVKEVPKPKLKEGDVLIKVQASALNRADLLQLYSFDKEFKNCLSEEAAIKKYFLDKI